MNKHYYWPFIFIFLSSVLFANQAPTIKLGPKQPKLQPIDRDWGYFKSVPCDQVDHLVSHSQTEKTFVERRKKQCTHQFDAFFSKPLEQ